MSEESTNDRLVYVTIGNSDDRLTQQKWCRFVSRTTAVIYTYATQVYGCWHSESAGPFQSACFGFDIAEGSMAPLRTALESLRISFEQDSIAWAVATPEMVQGESA